MLILQETAKIIIIILIKRFVAVVSWAGVKGAVTEIISEDIDINFVVSSKCNSFGASVKG